MTENMDGQEAVEPLFRVMVHAADLVEGAPFQPGSGAIRIELAPAQLRRLLSVLSVDAIEALTLMLDFGELRTDPLRVEVPGWGRPWLIEQGMGPYAAQKAAKELLDRGYVRGERMPGAAGPLGKKLGVVVGGRFGWQDTPEGLPHLAGRWSPRERVMENRSREDTSSQVSAFDGSSIKGSGHPVDNPGSPRDGSSIRGRVRQRESPSLDQVKPQVSAFDGDSLKGLSTAPTRKSGEEGSTTGPAKPGAAADPALTREGLHALLRDPATRAVLRQRHETALAAIGDVFRTMPVKAASAVEFLGREAGESPDLDLAKLVVELVTAEGAAMIETASAMESHLAQRSVQIPKRLAYPELLTGVVIAVTLAVDSPKVDHWPKYFAWALKLEGWRPSASIASLVRALTGLRDGTVAVTPAQAAHAAAESPEYRERLRLAVRGTAFDDEMSFEGVLRSPSLQQRLLRQYEDRLAASGE